MQVNINQHEIDMTQTNTIPSVIIFIDDNYEDMELMYPKYRLLEAGYGVVIAGPKAKQQYLGKHGYPCTSDAAISDIVESDFVGVICAGGWAPDKLRRLDKVKTLLAEFHQSHKLIAAICHGGWMPISAGVYAGVHVTGSPGIKDDLLNAGAIFADAPVVVDRHFVSSRKPDDLPAFMAEVLSFLSAHVKASRDVVHA
jgi:protease I